MLQARHGFMALAGAAVLLTASVAQAFCFSSGSKNSRYNNPYMYYAPPAPPAWQALYGNGAWPAGQPAVSYAPVYVQPQPHAYGQVVPQQPMLSH